MERRAQVASTARWVADFAPELWTLEKVRSFVRDHVLNEGVDVELVVLLACELATNAVSHAHTPYSVVLETQPAVLRVEVWDKDLHLPVVAESLAPYQEQGRGMLLVTSLAQSWGVDCNCSGKKVWFEVPREPAHEAQGPPDQASQSAA